MMNSLILHDLQLKKMKEFKFQQNLQLNLLKMTKFLRIKYLQTHCLIKKKVEFNDISTDELPDNQRKQTSSRFERWTHEGLRWAIHSILQHQLVI